MTQRSCWETSRGHRYRQHNKQREKTGNALSQLDGASVRRCRELNPAVTGKLEGMENRPEKRPPQGAGRGKHTGQ